MSDLKHYLDSYAKEGFINEYMEYLNNPNGKCPYVDIDAVGTKDENFYNDLTKFLSKCLGDSRYKFEGPDKSRYPFAIKFQDMTIPSDQYIYLTSDQFGFSAPCIDLRRKDIKCKKSAVWDGEKSYPYARYLSVNCDDDKGAGDSKKIEFVSGCIYETRTIGGSFIWPKVKIGRSYQSTYNRQRGAGEYIEDRVDITLYEISCFYDVHSHLKEKNYENFTKDYAENYPKNILFNRQDENEKKAIYRWLSIFETFEGYVEKLKFEDFVIKTEDGYLVRDMASKEASSPLDIAEIKKIKDMNPDPDSGELRILLENVKKRTELRSKQIENLLLKGGE